MPRWRSRILVLILVLIAAPVVAVAAAKAYRWAKYASVGEKGIVEVEAVPIRGTTPYLFLRGRDRENPVLLFLPGGPGESMVPLAQEFTDELQKHFVVAHVEFGVGKAEQYKTTPSLNDFIDDAEALVDHLTSRLGGPVYLVGHSLGSVQALKIAQRSPEKVAAVATIGQTVDWREGNRLTAGHLRHLAAERGDRLTLRKITSLPPTLSREIEAKLGAAIDSDAIHLHFQPIASLETGRVVALEALARWHDPDLGEIGPHIFVSVAEESGLIGRLGLKVLRMAIAEAARWTPVLAIAVNLSPIQVQDPNFCDDVSALLDEFNFSPERLELEVTESVMIRDAEAALATLRKLKALGVRIAMDDFGTGYSSLSYFRLFPFDKVKLDQSFVCEMATSQEALAVVQAVLGLARGLGLPVVAEGVENVEQLNMLMAEGCDQVQGYFLGRPAPIEAFVGSVIESRAPNTHTQCSGVQIGVFRGIAGHDLVI